MQATLQQPMSRRPPKHPYASSPDPKVEEPKQVPPATRTDSDDNEQQPKRARLTRKNLTLFNKIARKKGTIQASASSASESTAESSTTKTTSITPSRFAFQAYKNGILEPRRSKPPTNLEDLRKRYAESRGTASPTESAYEDYVDTVTRATNKATMVVDVGGELLKKYSKECYKRVFNETFTGYPKDVGFNNGLSAPQPDFAEGLEMQAYYPFLVDEHVSGAFLYKDDPHSLILPHLAGEWKGRRGDMEETRVQSAYDGAALVYARNQALRFTGKSDPPRHAAVTTFTTDGSSLHIFAHYAATSDDGRLEYHQYPVKWISLVDSHQGLQDGRRGLRNIQDYAREQSYALRDQLVEHWKQQRS